MQKFTLLIYSLCTLIVLAFALSSCKDDDDPFVPAKLSVADETLSISENEGTIEVELILDKAAPDAFTVEYSLGGTAISPADYSVVGREGEIDFAKGETSVVIEIEIANDAIFEGNETIEVTLEEVDTDNVTITNDDESVITILEDDVQVIASFSASAMTVNEDDALLEEYLTIEVNLNVPAPTDLTINYSIDGSALDSLFAYNEEIRPEFYDYYINGISGEVEIASGESTGVIEIQLIPDFKYEPTPETIILTLTEETSGVSIGDVNEMVITLEQQDGTVIALEWIQDEYVDVDMDMFLWAGADVSNLNIDPFYIAASTSTEIKQELIFLPKVIGLNAGFGLSYIYWGGTADPMNFTVTFADFADGTLEAGEDFETFSGSYTEANINKWDQPSGTDPIIAQTFSKVDGVITGISGPIATPASGSRMRTMKIPSTAKKTTPLRGEKLDLFRK